MASRDDRERMQRAGTSGAGLPAPLRAQVAAQKRAATKATGSINPEIDAQWAYGYAESDVQNSYFDYYFSGQDIQVHIEGHDKELDIGYFSFMVEQQKMPVYGFWDYAFATVMRGTRVVSGAFSLFTRHPDQLVRILSDAATSRANKNAKYIMRGLDTDEKLIADYWHKNLFDDTEFTYQDKNIFSAHPPFNIVIIYGIQSSSITGNLTARSQEVVNQYREDTPLMTDINERLVPTNQVAPARIVLENVEITKRSTEYSPDGTPIAESYAFFARDIVIPNSLSNYNSRKINAS